MSIESEGSRRSRASDILERRAQGSVRYSNEAVSMEVESHNASRGSHGMLGRHEPRGDIQLYPEETMRTHECDCYQNCVGADCACFRTLLVEPCVEGNCCEGCIRLKSERIRLAALQYQEMQVESSPTLPTAFPLQNHAKSGCSCKKTRCLKLYCECFSRKGYCGEGCNCEDCLNMVDSEARSHAIVENAGARDEERGCNCKKTRCEKKYCACYGAGAQCSRFCQCENCNNMDEELKLLRNYQAPVEQPFYPPMEAVMAVETLPTNIEFTEFELPEFARLSIS